MKLNTFLTYSLLTSSQGVFPLAQKIEAFHMAPLATITEAAPNSQQNKGINYQEQRYQLSLKFENNKKQRSCQCTLSNTGSKDAIISIHSFSETMLHACLLVMNNKVMANINVKQKYHGSPNKCILKGSFKIVN